MRITRNNIDDVFKSKVCGTETLKLKGYELVDELFADSSGFGQDDEPALTPKQLKSQLQQLVDKYGTVYTFLTGVGMFQVYIGVFTKTGVKKAKTIASNVLLVNNEDGTRSIRLYNTNILTENKDGTLTVDNGGYATRTTHKRINEFSNLYANSKQFETYINGVKLSEQNTFNGQLTV